MTSNFLYCLVCNQSTTHHENLKNCSAFMFMFKAISSKVTDENHSYILLMRGKQSGNKISKQGNFV